METEIREGNMQHNEQAKNSYYITLNREDKKIQSLDFKGKSKSGEEVTINSAFFEKNGQPWIPISGEFPFSRYSETEWEKGLRKMKAGGIEMVTSYIFWNHHEEERGVYRFDGCRDIRRFVELCQKVGLGFMLKIGPWVTAEARNGGFPDWVLDLPDVKGKVHGCTDTFLPLVKQYFSQLYYQLTGLMYKDGGPIIGIQIENEYTIHRAFSVDNGIEFLKKLKSHLIAIGFDVPFFFRTAWNTAIISGDELLPLYGAYCDAPWSDSLEEDPALYRFLLQNQKESDTFDLAIEANAVQGEDLEKCSEKTQLYEIWKTLKETPYLTIELGGGMQPSLYRRIISEKDDTEALTVCMLGRGANSLGYYVYHGGTHPNGVLSTMESTDNGVMTNTYPKKSYDFGSPISESTMLRESYHSLKKRLLLVKATENIMPITVPNFPIENAVEYNDFTSPRFCVRYSAELDSGFLFINNHVRKKSMPQRGFHITLETVHSKIQIPYFRVYNHEMRILPFNMQLVHGKLISTNAEFLTNIGDRYFFYTDDEPIYNIEGEAKITTLSMEDALYAYRFGDYMYSCNCIMYEKDGEVLAESIDEELTVKKIDKNGKIVEQRYRANICRQDNVTITLEKELEDRKVYTVDLSKLKTENIEDVLMTTEFLGDSVEIYDNGELITDWYTCGEAYQITLKRFHYPKSLEVHIFPHRKNGTVYFDIPIKKGYELSDIRLQTIYQFTLS